jgi:hypothetical protein
MGYDPDLEIPYAWDIKQVKTNSFVMNKFMLPIQHALLFPGIFFVYIGGVLKALFWIPKNLSIKVTAEVFLILMSFIGL